METYKKFGRSAFAKHLRRRKGKWTKTMANKKSRARMKLDIKNERRRLPMDTETIEYQRKIIEAMDKLMDKRNGEARELLSNCDFSKVRTSRFNSLLLNSYQKRRAKY